MTQHIRTHALVTFCATLLLACGSGPQEQPDEWASVSLSSGSDVGPSGHARAARGGAWQDALNRLARAVAAQRRTRSGEEPRVAVLDFTTSGGAECELGAPIAEALSGSLFSTGKVRVVERRLLAKVLEQNMLSQSDLYDPGQVARLGRLAGVDAIVVGTIEAADASYAVTARLIAAESGEWLAAGQVTIDRREAEQRGRCRGAALVRDAPRPVRPDEPGAPERATTSGPRGQFFYEDFRRVPDGQVPQGWAAGNRLLVTGVGRERGLQLTSRSGDDTAVVSGIAFAEDFRLELLVSRHYQETLMVQSGDLKFGLHWLYAQLGEEQRRISVEDDQLHVLAVEKRGDVLKLFLDGQEQIVVRDPDFAAADLLRIEMADRARLMRITGTAL